MSRVDDLSVCGRGDGGDVARVVRARPLPAQLPLPMALPPPQRLPDRDTVQGRARNLIYVKYRCNSH